MLEVAHLSKRFGSLQALDDVSIEVGDGEVVGFVGANGAGKSTTMRIIMGSVEADAGTVTWDGAPLSAALRRRIGYMPEERGLYPKMSVASQLMYLARLHGVDKARARQTTDLWLERLGIADRRGDTVQKLSLGNQQRVQLAAALVGDPALLILDEPFSGLDPVAVDVMSEVLRERADAAVPTLFSSHQLDLVERLCDRIVIIRAGRLVAAGTIEQLAATQTPQWRVVVQEDERATTSAALLPTIIERLPQGQVSRDTHGRLVLTATGNDEQDLLAAAMQVGTVRELGPVRRSLADIFRQVLSAPDTDSGPDSPSSEEPTSATTTAQREDH